MGDRPYVLHPRWSSLQELRQARVWADGFLRLDLGSGYVTPTGFIGLDNLSGEDAQAKVEERAPDLLLDLNRQRIPISRWFLSGDPGDALPGAFESRPYLR
jgi:hypothetical protein